MPLVLVAHEPTRGAPAQGEDPDLVARIQKNARRSGSRFPILAGLCNGNHVLRFARRYVTLFEEAADEVTFRSLRASLIHPFTAGRSRPQLLSDMPQPDLGSKKDVLDVLQVRAKLNRVSALFRHLTAVSSLADDCKGATLESADTRTPSGR